MKKSTHSYEKNNFLHHAYLMVGDFNLSLSEIEKNFSPFLKFPIKGNPDYKVEKFETLGIGDARKIIEFSLQKPLREERKFIILAANTITREAQNALLKLLEEPTDNTHFFLILPRGARMLKTLKSRVMEEGLDSRLKRKAKPENGLNFFKKTIEQRIKEVGLIIEEKSKEKLNFFLDDIEGALKDLGENAKNKEERITFLKQIVKIREYSHDRAPSFKILLEHIAYNAPKSQ